MRLHPSRIPAVLLFFTLSMCGFGQPWVSGVTNSASYATTVAPGSIFVLFGWNLGPSELVQVSEYPLPKQLGGTSVEVTVGGSTLPCPMVYAYWRQVAAILPSATPLGDGTIRVKYGGQTSYSATIHVVKASFGIYTTSASGSGPGSITTPNYALNTFTNPARPGDIIVLWGTGLGAAPGDDGAGPQPGVRFDGVSVFVGNQKANVLYAGRSGSAGLDQINVELPATLPDGCFVPVSVESESRGSNYVSIAIDRLGQTCTNDSGVPADLLVRAVSGEAMKVGIIALGPLPVLHGAGFPVTPAAAQAISGLLRVKVSDSDVAQMMKALRARDRKEIDRILARYKQAGADLTPRVIRKVRAWLTMDQLAATAAFSKLTGLAIGAPQVGAFSPPSGTCTVLKNAPVGPGSRSAALDAGALTLSGPLGTHALTQYMAGEYQVNLGSGFVSGVPAGTYQVTASGGKDIGPFTVPLTVGAPIVWSNKASISYIDRTQPLTITWSGGPASGHVLIGGSAQLSGSSAAFVCVQEAARGQFTIPAAVLSSLPASDAKDSYIFVGPHPLGSGLSVPGLDLIYFANAAADYGNVQYR